MPTTFDVIRKAIIQKGPPCLESVGAIQSLLDEIQLSEQTALEEVYGAILSVLVNWTNSKNDQDSGFFISKTMIPMFIESLSTFFARLAKPLDWRKAFFSLDKPGIVFETLDSITVAIMSYKYITRSNEFHPITVFWEIWKCKEVQFSFLSQAIAAPTELINIATLSVHSVLPNPASLSDPRIRERANQLSSSPWINVHLIETCLMNINKSDKSPAFVLFEEGLKTDPDLIFLGLIIFLPFKNIWHRNTLSKLYAQFLDGTLDGSFSLYMNWILDSTALFEGMYHCTISDDKYLVPTIRIFKELDLISALYFSNDFDFTLPLIALAYQKRYINFQHWIEDKFDAFDDVFLVKVLDFIRRVHKKLVPEAELGDLDNLTYETIAVFFQIFLKNKITRTQEVHIKACLKVLTDHYSPFQQLLLDFIQQDNIFLKFPSDVEKEVNSLYERLYRSQFRPSDLAEILINYRSSTEPRKLALYASSIALLIEEYYQLTAYPDMELGLTALLLGQLVAQKAIIYSYNKMLVLCIANGLNKPKKSKLNNFSLIAMSQIKGCINKIPLLDEFFKKQPHLLETIPTFYQENIGSQAEDVSRVNPPQNYDDSEDNEHLNDLTFNQNSFNSPQEKGAPSFSAASVDTLLSSKQKQGDIELNKELQEKLVFLINNLSSTNIADKVKEFKSIINNSAYSFFSDYIVVRRISTEINNHPVYLQFLDMVAEQELSNMILDDTYKNIHILLKSEGTANSADERALLKTLGSWLGAITLAKNKPILHDKLYLKGTLIEGYLDKRLIVAIPFTCKVLAQGIKGDVFLPPNPWLMGILKFLLELSKIPGSKNNLNFEIEMLFNKFNLKTNDIEPSNLLMNIELYADQEISRTVGMKINGELFDIKNLNKHVYIDPNSSFAQDKNLTMAAFIALEVAITKTYLEVKEHALPIVFQFTKVLITKDFAMEPDEEKLRQAAHQMSGSTVVAYIHANYKESFIKCFMDALREQLVKNNLFPLIQAPKELEDVVTNNVRVGLYAIQTMALKDAPRFIDQYLQDAIGNRKKTREARGQSYYDVGNYNASNQLPPMAPEILKLKPTGVTPAQLRLYQRFNLLKFEIPDEVSKEEFINHLQPETLEYIRNGEDQLRLQASDERALDNLLNIINGLDRRLDILQEDKDALDQTMMFKIFNAIDEILNHIARRDVLLYEIAKKYITRIYSAKSNGAQQVYIHLLTRLCPLSNIVTRRVNHFFIYSEDVYKYNPVITKSLIINDLLEFDELDEYLGKLIQQGRGDIVDYSLKLISRCILDEPCVGNLDSFAHTREGLLKLSRMNHTSEQIMAILDDIKNQYDSKKREQELQNTCHFYYNEWTRVYMLSNPNEKDYYEFVSKLSQHGILQDEQMMAMFIRTSVQISFDLYAENSKDEIDMSKPIYHHIDSMAKMIITIIIYAQDQHNETHASRTGLFTNTLTVLALMLVHAHHKKEKSFNPKPFYRLYSSILYHLNSQEDKLIAIQPNLILAFNKSLSPLQPEILPGFAYAWVSLISHKLFFPKLMALDNKRGWEHAQVQFSYLFRFLSTIMVPTHSKTGWDFYLGAIRLTISVMHDYPQFMVSHHFGLVSELPISCAQISSLISAATPANFEYPRPSFKYYSSNPKPEYLVAPPVFSDYTTPLEKKGIADFIRNHITDRDQIEFLVDLKAKLYKTEEMQEYDQSLIYCLALFVGITDLQTNPDKNASTPRQSAMDIYQKLLIDFDPQGRFIFLNALICQLRYPNLHTCYFSQVILGLYSTATNIFAKEQIIRVLIDRVVLKNPVPWGIWCLLTDLYEDPVYALVEQPFIKDQAELIEFMERCVTFNKGVPKSS
ncbi:Not1-domain-containing protein [Neoconidiobolus thromboides FSU 785]|nr:Not1-domain-containing protein [Neoconidiobolus thromboides FSU 785]